MKYFATLSKYRLGQIDEAYKEVSKPTHENDYEYWLLVMEIAFMKEDVVLAKYCYQHMIAIYPDKATESSNNFKTMLENYELMQRLTA